MHSIAQEKHRDFPSISHFISEIVQDSYYGMRMRIRNHAKLSNGTIFNDLSHFYPDFNVTPSTLNISETVRDTDIYNDILIET